MAGKSVNHSQVIMSNVMLPQHANQSGRSWWRDYENDG